jgi:hypothetical protein
MEAVRASETSICSNETTRRYIPEGFNLHTRRRENMKSHFIHFILILISRGIEVSSFPFNDLR